MADPRIMSEGLGRYITGKVVVAVLAVASVIVIIWYARLEPADRAAMWGGVRSGLIWLGLVAALPWALFFVPGRVVRMESNAASGILLVVYLLIDAGLALYLAGGVPAATWHRALLVLGLLSAAVYNFGVCEFLAARSEDRV